MKDEKNLSRDQRGSALISVVISMLFLLSLGLTLLFVSYTGFHVAAAQRSEKETFYSAEAAMEDIRLGLQTLLSDALVPAYTQALAYYSAVSGGNQTALNDRLIQELLTKKSGTTSYFQSTNINGKQALSGYSAQALLGFVRSAAKDYVQLTGEGTIRQVNDENGVLQAVVLEGLSLVYIKSGYESKLETDIRIEMPAFQAAVSAVPGIDHYSLITDGKIRLEAASPAKIEISGNVFAEEGFFLSGKNSVLTLTEGDLFSRGPLVVEDGASLAFTAPERELWAESLRLEGAKTEGESSKLSLEGKVYLAGGLVLNGANIELSLKNSLFGFGSDRENPEESSAISILGEDLKNVSLDFSGLNALYLAGTNLLDLSEAELFSLSTGAPFEKPLIMGQSAAFDFSGQDYLVPPAAVKNYMVSDYPFTLRPEGIGLPKEGEDTNGENAHLPEIDLEAVLWQIEDEDKHLSDYIGGEKGEIQALYHLKNGEKLVFLYLDFADEQAANAYFEDYFAVNYKLPPEEGQDKLPRSKDVSLLLPEESALIATAGMMPYTPKRETGGEAENLPEWAIFPAAQQIFTEDLQQKYESLSSLYLQYVNTEKLDQLVPNNTYEFKNEKGEVVAIITTMDHYTLPSFSSTLQLVIAKNKVTVPNTGFNGLILAGEDIFLKGDAGGAALDPELAEAVCTQNGGLRLADFLKNSSRLLGADRESWNLNELVAFENWKKG